MGSNAPIGAPRAGVYNAAMFAADIDESVLASMESYNFSERLHK
jgi:hypothetical protein